MEIKIIADYAGCIPCYKTKGSAGCDLVFCSPSPLTIKAGQSVIVGTGIAVRIPSGFEGQVRGRSGLNFKESIIVPVGTIDSDYRGEVKVKLYNLSERDYTLQPFERVAQLVIAPVEQVEFEVINDFDFDMTDRGSNGFGSTGK